MLQIRISSEDDGEGNKLDFMNLADSIYSSLLEQQHYFDDCLILNPVENIPDPKILTPSTSFLHGLYNTDTIKTEEEKINSKIQFSGRSQITNDINKIYTSWAELLGGEGISMRLLSGLHAHIVIFMAITEIGQRVMALPEKAGGHVSSYAILKRLGLQIKDIPYNCTQMKIDQEKCISDIEAFQPDVIFVDRSEGLVYEDFSWLGHYKTEHPCYKIFDASQYLTNIICYDYRNPFEMGFDLIITTMHKNLPGPQRALVCAKKSDEMWKRLRSGISTYVSNMHTFSIYSAGLLLSNYEQLKTLSKNMLQNACTLDAALQAAGVPIIARQTDSLSPPTHHCWIGPLDKVCAYELYCSLEQIGLMTNYRLLPYDIGYGLRLGLSGATQSGLRAVDIPELAEIISTVYGHGVDEQIKGKAHHFIRRVKGIDKNDPMQ